MGKIIAKMNQREMIAARRIKIREHYQGIGLSAEAIDRMMQRPLPSEPRRLSVKYRYWRRVR